MITGVKKIIVPVDNEVRAREFWTTRLGFDVMRDKTSSRERWIEVSPPDHSLVLVLSRRRSDEPKQKVPDQLPHSDIFFTCDDIQEIYGELTERGVKFPAPPIKTDFGWVVDVGRLSTEPDALIVKALS